VFGIVVDPVGEGFVNSLARPGGNTASARKWLDLLKGLAPGLNSRRE
jgi:putative tryptophan/tyrosine transport system substrate-binding protein